jgi:hypothetical protein
MPTDLKTLIANFTNWLKAGVGDAPTWQKEHKERLSWYRGHLAGGADIAFYVGGR